MSLVVTMSAQTITRKVQQANGQGIENARILLAGVEVAKTDKAGEFSLTDISTNQIINIEHQNFKNKDVVLADIPSVVSLEPLIHKTNIEVGYNTILKERLTQAVSSYSGDELSPHSTFTLGNRLSGKLSGLSIIRTGAEPANDIPNMYIRGTSTYNANNVLVFVDGFESNLNNLLPEEIESITVLKDAAALAVYGIRGANGVILVTTKRGVESKVQIKLDSKLGFSSPIRTNKFTDAHTYASLYNEAISNDMGHWSPVYNKYDLDLYRDNSDAYFHPNVNWYDETMRSSVPYSENTLSFRGGNQFAKYYVMLGYVEFDKLYKKNEKHHAKELRSMSETSRFNFRGNVDVDINHFWSASVDIGGNISERSTPNHPNLVNLAASTPPNAFPIFNMDGSWGASNVHKENPYGTLLEKGKLALHDVNVQAGFTLKQNLNSVIEGLELFESISFISWTRKNYDRTRDYERYRMVENSKGLVLTEKVDGTNTDYSINEGKREHTLRTSYNLGSRYNNTFSTVHTVSALLGFMYSKYEVDGNNSPYKNAGLYGSTGYAYNSKYLADFSFAYNGSENLPQDKRFGFFPAISFGWILSNEDFLKKMKDLNFLKLRVSAGLVGNSYFGVSRFAYQTYYTNMNNKLNLGSSANVSLAAQQEGRIGNPNITWEKNYKYNIGVDTRIFNMIDASLDVFYEKRRGILSTYESVIPGIVGATLPYENIGKVSNKGFEVELNYASNVAGVEYYVGGNFSFARNKIGYMAEENHLESYLYKTGRPVGQMFGLQAEGLFQDYDEINAHNTPVHLFSDVQPGDIRYKDQNNDGYIDENDLVPIGKPTIPEINYRFNFGVAYKGIDLRADLYGQANSSIILEGNNVWAFYNEGQAPAIAEKRWAFYPDQGIDTRSFAQYPRLTTTNNENNYRSSTFWLKNASFLRLQNIELGYSFPQRICNKMFLSKLRLYVQASNVATISSMSDFDPEITYGYPLNKAYSFGVNIYF